MGNICDCLNNDSDVEGLVPPVTRDNRYGGLRDPPQPSPVPVIAASTARVTQAHPPSPVAKPVAQVLPQTHASPPKIPAAVVSSEAGIEKVTLPPPPPRTSVKKTSKEGLAVVPRPQIDDPLAVPQYQIKGSGATTIEPVYAAPLPKPTSPKPASPKPTVAAPEPLKPVSPVAPKADSVGQLPPQAFFNATGDKVVQPVTEDESFAEFIKDRTRGNSALLESDSPLFHATDSIQESPSVSTIPPPLSPKPLLTTNEPAIVAPSPDVSSASPPKEKETSGDFTDYLDQVVAQTKKTIIETATTSKQLESPEERQSLQPSEAVDNGALDDRMSNVDLDSSPSPLEKSPSPDDFERQKASSNADVEKVPVQNSFQQMTDILSIPGSKSKGEKESSPFEIGSSESGEVSKPNVVASGKSLAEELSEFGEAQPSMDANANIDLAKPDTESVVVIGRVALDEAAAPTVAAVDSPALDIQMKEDVVLMSESDIQLETNAKALASPVISEKKAEVDDVDLSLPAGKMEDVVLGEAKVEVASDEAAAADSSPALDIQDSISEPDIQLRTNAEALASPVIIEKEVEKILAKNVVDVDLSIPAAKIEDLVLGDSKVEGIDVIVDETTEKVADEAATAVELEDDIEIITVSESAVEATKSPATAIDSIDLELTNEDSPRIVVGETDVDSTVKEIEKEPSLDLERNVSGHDDDDDLGRLVDEISPFKEGKIEIDFEESDAKLMGDSITKDIPQINQDLFDLGTQRDDAQITVQSAIEVVDAKSAVDLFASDLIGDVLQRSTEDLAASKIVADVGSNAAKEVAAEDIVDSVTANAVKEFSTDDLFSTDDDDLLITKEASPLYLQPSQKEEIKIESFSGLETLGEIITEQVLQSTPEKEDRKKSLSSSIERKASSPGGGGDDLSLSQAAAAAAAVDEMDSWITGGADNREDVGDDDEEFDDSEFEKIMATAKKMDEKAKLRGDSDPLIAEGIKLGGDDDFLNKLAKKISKTSESEEEKAKTLVSLDQSESFSTDTSFFSAKSDVTLVEEPSLLDFDEDTFNQELTGALTSMSQTVIPAADVDDGAKGPVSPVASAAPKGERQ